MMNRFYARKAILTTAVCLFFTLGNCQQQQQHQLKTSNVQEDPCKVKSKVVADVAYCDRYWECVDGQPELYDCPNGLVFAGKYRGVTEGCDYPWRSDYCENKQPANGPISREHCEWLYGIFGHETSCTRYWTCWNGTATEQLCIGGLLYNEATRSCDWPDHVEGCQKHPLCNEEPNGNVPLGKSCNRYWQCQGGYPRLQRCPAMLVFDKRSLRCVIPPTEDCDIPTTPPPSPEDLQEQRQQEEDDSNVPQQVSTSLKTTAGRVAAPHQVQQQQQSQQRIPAQPQPVQQPHQRIPSSQQQQIQQQQPSQQRIPSTQSQQVQQPILQQSQQRPQSVIPPPQYQNQPPRQQIQQQQRLPPQQFQLPLQQQPQGQLSQPQQQQQQAQQSLQPVSLQSQSPTQQVPLQQQQSQLRREEAYNVPSVSNPNRNNRPANR